MGLETATYIDGLVVTNPVAGDVVSQGDDHLRLLKSTIKATFPSISGAVNLTHTQLNLLDDKSLAASGYQKFPSGLIVQWGTATAGENGSTATNSFPIAFTTAAYVVIPVHYGTEQTVNIVLDSGTPPTTTQFRLRSNFVGSSVTCHYVAVGR